MNGKTELGNVSRYYCIFIGNWDSYYNSINERLIMNYKKSLITREDIDANFIEDLIEMIDDVYCNGDGQMKAEDLKEALIDLIGEDGYNDTLTTYVNYCDAYGYSREHKSYFIRD